MVVLIPPKPECALPLEIRNAFCRVMSDLPISGTHPLTGIDLHAMNGQEHRNACKEMEEQIALLETSIVELERHPNTDPTSDSQIALLKASVVELQTHRNSLIPIARLPPEILVQVFTVFINRGSSEFSSGDMTWMRLAKVCRHWHSLIMGTPTLWSFLLFNNVKLTAEMLRRSRSSPLVVKAEYPDSLEAVELALSHLSRVRVLHLNGSDEYFCRLFTFMNRPAPLLESFSLHRSPWCSESINMTTLFEGVSPHLRYFISWYLDVPWDLLILRNLTHLEIRSSALKPSLIMFRDVLSRCPALETLSLGSALPRDADQREEFHDPIPLPKLLHLALVGDIAECEIAVRNISFPPDTHVALYFPLNFDSTPPELPLLLSDLVARRCGASSIRHLHIQSLPPIWRQHVQFRTWQTVDDKRSLLHISFEKHDVSPSFFLAVCQPLALTQLFSLHVDVSQLPGTEQSSWLTVLSCCPKLKELTVKMEHMADLLSALDAFSEKGTRPSTRPKMVLPYLQELALHGASFVERQTFEDLRTWLKLRWEDDAAIHTLRLANCINLREHDVDDLEQFVDIVMCYGTVQVEDTDREHPDREDLDSDGLPDYGDSLDIES
jgi:hypothetical protein